MKANRKAKQWKYDAAQVGIGTMIVFIATVLVAAVAASVLIDTSGKLQERSTRTGNEATQQVSSNFAVVKVLGKRDNTSTDLTDLNITVSLAPGASSIDMSQLKIQVNNGTVLKVVGWQNAAAASGTFNTTSLRDADSSFTATNPVMNAGDLVEINIDLDANGLTLAPRKQMRLLLLPEVGTPVRADFTSPASYGAETIVDLR